MVNGKKKLVFALAALLGAKLFALDLSVIGGAGNLSFDTNAETPLGGNDPFTGSFYPLGTITLTDQVSPVFGYSVQAERDPLLRTMLLGEITITAGVFKLSAGPLMSLFNTRTTPFRPGVSAGMGLDFPGILFFTVHGGATFGGKGDHDYSLETGSIAFGFRLPNLLNTISLTSSQFGESGAVYVEDTLFRASYRALVFEKNVPYTVAIEMGYQTLERSYGAAGSDLLRVVFLGFETAVTVKPQLTLIFGAETPLYVWGRIPLEREKGRWFFRAFTGFTWNFAPSGE